MRLKKNVGGNVATSSAGKTLIKEFVGKDGVKIIDIVKKIVTIHDSKKKLKMSKTQSFVSQLKSSSSGKTKTLPMRT